MNFAISGIFNNGSSKTGLHDAQASSYVCSETDWKTPKRLVQLNGKSHHKNCNVLAQLTVLKSTMAL